MQPNHHIEDKIVVDGIDIYTKYDPKTHLNAFIAIHSLKRGPAMGGCRLMHYSHRDYAIQDAMRLAKGMTYKSAMSGLHFGGGKTVIIRPSCPIDKETFWKSYCEFVNTLQGKYITSADSGTDQTDLDIMANYTSYITGHTRPEYSSTFPSPFTAKGIIRGIEAAAYFKLKRDSLEGINIAVQGLGSVGYQLVAELMARGARLTVTDTNMQLLQRCQDEFDVNAVEPGDIYKVECDIFSPNALGGILNEKTIPLMKASIVAGSANNQLASLHDGWLLAKKGILYVPDYVINAGGLLFVAGQYSLTAIGQIVSEIDAIYFKLLEIFEVSRRSGLPTHQVADIMAEAQLC